MLSPTELLGLSGATLENSVRRAVNHVADSTLARVADRLRADAIANEVIYEHDGRPEAVRIMLRPLLAMPEQLSYVGHVCMKITEALKRVPDLYLEDPEVRQILSIAPQEEQLLRDTWTGQHQKLNPVYGRLDAVCDFTAAGWQDSLQFMEPNLSGVGGIHFAPLAEQIVMRNVMPTLLAHDPELTVTLPLDQRDLFVQILIDHSRALGRNSCHLCFVEPKYVHDGPNEQSQLGLFLSARHGLTIEHADPTELRVVGDEVYYNDLRVDVVYRDYEMRDLLALERSLGRTLSAMRLLFRQNRVISSLVGDFDHKSCWELLTDETLSQRFFSLDQRRLFRRHILWTRLIRDRKTSLPHGVNGDLLDFVSSHRDQLVLKPNRGYGGIGVTMGTATSQGDWDQLLSQAVVKSDDPQESWVVQAATRLPVHAFPVLGPRGLVFEEPFHAVMGFAATENGLGVLCRVSQKQVVNVAQNGGLAAVLTAHAPRKLAMRKRAPQRSQCVTDALRSQIQEMRHLDNIIGLLGWDEETMLPALGRAQRGEQLATLEGQRRALLAADRLGDLIEEVAEYDLGDERWERELDLLRRLRRMSLALPDDLVRAFAKAKSRALGAWENALARDNFLLFAPFFEEIVGLARERAQALAVGTDPFDALLDEHEPGLTRSRLEPVFAELRDWLVPWVRQRSEANRQLHSLLSGRQFPEAQQWAFCRQMLDAVGFDFNRGRFDRSTHPFTLAAGLDDVRLTIRIDERNLFKAVLCSLHEAGHGLYDQGFEPADNDWLLGDAPSTGLHESQARLWENHVGRSRAHWEYWYPTLQRLFPNALMGLDVDSIHREVNLVRSGPVRAPADEASYHLHILLRHELEVALLSGDLPVSDLKSAWDRRCLELLGIQPSSDREGVLQDVHWSLGIFGYFPSYTVGSLYAAQLMECYGRDHSLPDQILQGDFRTLLAWLRQHIHRVGQKLSSEALVSRITGLGLDTAAFSRHIRSAG